ncbi:MAG: prephenate dehydrogenase [Bacteroidales bacterium]
MDLRKKSLAIVGTGQIGCSLGLGLHGKVGLIAGVDTNKSSIDQAIQQGMVDVEWSLHDAIAYANIIIVACPVDVAIPIITEILDYADEKTVVIDMGSTKASICNALKNHFNRKNFVAAHPMAGSSVMGPSGADIDLFSGCKTYICEPQLSSSFAIKTASELFHHLNSKIEYLEPVQHDRLVGLVSHFPQMVSYSMCNVLRVAENDNPEWENIASSGFDSTSRLAKSPASMWLPIVNQNKENVLKYISLMIDELQRLQVNISSSNQSAIADFIDSAVDVREKFEESRKQLKAKNNGKRNSSSVAAA